MGKGKLAKFADMARMDRVFEFPIKYLEGNSEDAPFISDAPQPADAAATPQSTTPHLASAATPHSTTPNLASAATPHSTTPNPASAATPQLATPDPTGVAAPLSTPTAKRLIIPDCPLRGHWHEQVFHNTNPIVLELGCGRGEYTVGLARLHPDMNFIGVDIKGARMWTGAREAERDNLQNVAFLRTNIEIIDHFFAPGEVSELWLTFSDPQMKKVTKRLTGTSFIQRYRRFLTDGGVVHLKTDSNFLFTYTEEMLRANSITPIVSTRDLYFGLDVEGSGEERHVEGIGGDRCVEGVGGGKSAEEVCGGRSIEGSGGERRVEGVGGDRCVEGVGGDRCVEGVGGGRCAEGVGGGKSEEDGVGGKCADASHDMGAHGNTVLLSAARAIQTYYEQMWRERGIPIKYLAFALHQQPQPLREPEVEIPLDEYRSYNRSKRSGSESHA